MTMPVTTTPTTHDPSARIAAGVTATYLLDLTRRPAPAPSDGHRPARTGRAVAAPRFARDRGGVRRRISRLSAGCAGSAPALRGTRA